MERRLKELRRAGRADEALSVARQLLLAQPGRADLLREAGGLCLETGRAAEGAGLLERAVAAEPQVAVAHFALGNALRALGRNDGALAAYRRAAALRPDVPRIRHAAGTLLQAMGRHAEAAEEYRAVLDLAPDAPEAARNLGLALEEGGRGEAAVEAYRRALALKPDWTVVHSALATLLLSLGRPAEAVAVCADWRRFEPWSMEALAYEALAHNELGRQAEAGGILDFDRFVRVVRPAPPEGFADTAAFNRALAAHAQGHPTLKLPREDDPTYHHPKLLITDELLAEPWGPMRAFDSMLRREIEAYRRSIPAEPAHPFLTEWPERFHLTVWAVVLNGQGNLVPHIHLSGHLGGVYYPQLPPEIGQGEGDESGWFELGRPPGFLNCGAEPRIRRVRAEEGRLILFPAYMYHGTVPFRSERDRISVAFDPVPER